MKCELKNVRVNQRLSEETACFSATLYIDGVRAADVGNRGHGGPNEYHFKDRDLEKRFYAYCESLPPKPDELFPEGLSMDADMLVGDLLERFELEKLCKGRTVFRLAGKTYQKGAWDVYNKMPYETEGKAYLAKHHAGKVAEVLNEQLAAGSPST